MGDSNLMNIRLLSDTLARLSSGADFSIKTSVGNSSDYDTHVVFVDPSRKPSWSEVESSKADTRWVAIRAERGRKLSSCDWTALSDVPLSSEKRGEWEVYRQSLRDIPDQSDPFSISWPTRPL